MPGHATDNPLDPQSPPKGTAQYAGHVLLEARLARRPHPWTQLRLISAMHQVACNAGHMLPPTETLRRMVNHWEHGRKAPGGFYREVLAEALDIDVTDLALPPDRRAFRPLHG